MYSYIVIGAGPAGLAFASSINDSNVLVIDLGKPLSKRDRFNSEECVQGAGGAGLFSDGKFSFYPAGTGIWQQDKVRLRAAYQILERELGHFTQIPKFPEINSLNKHISEHKGWFLKSYKSIYLTLKERMELTSSMTDRCSEIRYQTEFLHQQKIEGGYLIKLRDISSGEFYFLQTKKLIFAGGRFMPLFLNCSKQFRRYELGFRVIGPVSLVQKEVNLIDPKYIFEKEGIEYRTFCWCENGEVVKTSFNGIESFSGRADCEPTGMSNFGFNLRIKDPSLLSKVDFNQLIYMDPFDISIKSFLQGTTFSHLIEYGLRKLLDRFNGLYTDGVRLVGPTIEGVGEYPTIDEEFELIDSPGVYVIGDCSGIYRGIVPSMIAGYALAVKENSEIMNQVGACSSYFLKGGM